MANRKLIVEIIGDDRSLQRALGRSERATSGFSGTLKSLGKTAGLAAGVAGLGAIAYSLRAGIGEWQESTKVAAQTQAVLKSTGGAANITARQVDELANSLLRKSGVDDETIKSGENVLLTFRNIRNEAGKGNDIFGQATRATLDLSVALGKDMTSSAILVGKALNDPVGALGALTRAGVQFSAAQKGVIKDMVAAGDTMGAQKMILKELNAEFGGSAEAVGKTLPGQIAIARESFKNFTADLVAKMIPAITQAVNWTRDHWPEISAAISQAWQTVKPILQALADLFMGVVAVVRDHWPFISRNLQAVQTVVQDVAKVIAATLRLVIDLIHGDWSKAWDDLKVIVGSSLDAAKTVAVTAAKNLLAIVSGLGRDIYGALKVPFDAVVDLARTSFAAITTFMSNTFTGIVKFWADLPGRVADAVKDKAKELWDGVKHIFDLLPGFVKDALGISSPSKVFAEIGEAIVHGAIKGIENKAGDLVGKAQGVFGSIAKAATGAASAIGSVFSGPTYGGLRYLGRQMAAAYGWGSGAEWKALDALWTQESGWNQYAKNPQSGAYGIAQALPPTKMPFAAQQGGGSDAAAQIKWGLDYIKARYRDPVKAWGGYWQRGGWYAQGGVFNRPTIIGVGERGPEAVVPLSRIGGGNTYHFHFDNYLGDKRELESWMRQTAKQFERRNARSAFA